jgi:hypothetical protein
MRKTKKSTSFILCLIINIILNFEWSIPSWVLLICHLIFDISIVWFFIALAVWILIILFWMLIFGWASKCSSNNDLPKKNKNPYSSKGSQYK